MKFSWEDTLRFVFECSRALNGVQKLPTITSQMYYHMT